MSDRFSYPLFVQQFSNPRNGAEELLQDEANAAIYRGEFPWFVPQQVDLVAGAGDELYGLGGNDRLYGGLDNDNLIGGEGDDLLYGFAGSDFMAGGAGDDSYVVSGVYDLRFNYAGGEYVAYFDDSLDELYEAADEGIDTVYSEVDFALGENFENLTLLNDTRDFDPAFDPAEPVSTLRFGREIANFGEGNALDNIIVGNVAGNVLFGLLGEDTLRDVAVGLSRADAFGAAPRRWLARRRRSCVERRRRAGHLASGTLAAQAPDRDKPTTTVRVEKRLARVGREVTGSNWR